MTDQEREQVLRMIESGKISAEDGLKLMRTLDQSKADDDVQPIIPVKVPLPAPDSTEERAVSSSQAERSKFENDPRIEKVKSTVRRLWQIPLWIGIFITVVSAWGMYMLVRAAHLNFWFYALVIPLLLGVLVIVAAVGSRKARWLFVDVRQKPGEKPSRIFMGFPLPLKLTAWFLRTFGRYFSDHGKTNLDAVIQVIETGLSGEEPLVVNVDEGEDGDRVRVYIG